MTRGNRTHYREYTKTSTEIRTPDLLKILFLSKLYWENTNSKEKEREREEITPLCSSNCPKPPNRVRNSFKILGSVQEEKINFTT